MDWLCGQAAFIYAFNKVSQFYTPLSVELQHNLTLHLSSFKQVKPAAIVDTIVEAVVDILVPGRGAGESNW